MSEVKNRSNSTIGRKNAQTKLNFFTAYPVSSPQNSSSNNVRRLENDSKGQAEINCVERILYQRPQDICSSAWLWELTFCRRLECTRSQPSPRPFPHEKSLPKVKDTHGKEAKLSELLLYCTRTDEEGHAVEKKKKKNWGSTRGLAKAKLLVSPFLIFFPHPVALITIDL